MKSKKNILIFYPYNKIAVDQISVIELLSKKHNIFFLSIDNYGPLHKIIHNMNIINYSIQDSYEKNGFFIKIKLFYYLHMFVLFSKIISRHNIDIVFSHLEIPGLISSISSYFYRFKNYYFRHNMDAMSLDSNIKGRFANRIVNFLSKNIICVSDPVKNYLITNEKVNSKKINVIEYGYDFDKYFDYQFHNKVSDIRKKYNSEILLISVGRLVPLKRHLVLLQLMYKLNNSFKNKFKLIILGEGPEQKKMVNYCKKYNLENVFLLGFKENIIDYIKASDLLIHFSHSESFGHVVLEAGLSSVPALACKNTGVFEKFIYHKINGYLINKNDPLDESFELLSNINSKELQKMGKKLHKTVLENFNIKNVINKYFDLIEGC